MCVRTGNGEAMAILTPRIKELRWAQLKAIRALNQNGEIATADQILREIEDDAELFRRKSLVPSPDGSTSQDILTRRHEVALRCSGYEGFVFDIPRNGEWRLTPTGSECAEDRSVFERRISNFQRIR